MDVGKQIYRNKSERASERTKKKEKNQSFLAVLRFWSEMVTNFGVMCSLHIKCIMQCIFLVLFFFSFLVFILFLHNFECVCVRVLCQLPNCPSENSVYHLSWVMHCRKCRKTHSIHQLKYIFYFCFCDIPFDCILLEHHLLLLLLALNCICISMLKMPKVTTFQQIN